MGPQTQAIGPIRKFGSHTASSGFSGQTRSPPKKKKKVTTPRRGLRTHPLTRPSHRQLEWLHAEARREADYAHLRRRELGNNLREERDAHAALRATHEITLEASGDLQEELRKLEGDLELYQALSEKLEDENAALADKPRAAPSPRPPSPSPNRAALPEANGALLAEAQTLKEANEALRREAQGYQETIKALHTKADTLRSEASGLKDASEAMDEFRKELRMTEGDRDYLRMLNQALDERNSSLVQQAYELGIYSIDPRAVKVTVASLTKERNDLRVRLGAAEEQLADTAKLSKELAEERGQLEALKGEFTDLCEAHNALDEAHKRLRTDFAALEMDRFEAAELGKLRSPQPYPSPLNSDSGIEDHEMGTASPSPSPSPSLSHREADTETRSGSLHEPQDCEEQATDTCGICHERGHTGRDCPNLQKAIDELWAQIEREKAMEAEATAPSPPPPPTPPRKHRRARRRRRGPRDLDSRRREETPPSHSGKKATPHPESPATRPPFASPLFAVVVHAVPTRYRLGDSRKWL